MDSMYLPMRTPVACKPTARSARLPSPTPNQSKPRRGSSARRHIAVGPYFRLARYVADRFDLHRLVRHVHGFDEHVVPRNKIGRSCFFGLSARRAPTPALHHASAVVVRLLEDKPIFVETQQILFHRHEGTAAPLLRRRRVAACGRPAGSKADDVQEAPGLWSPAVLPAFNL